MFAYRNICWYGSRWWIDEYERWHEIKNVSDDEKRYIDEHQVIRKRQCREPSPKQRPTMIFQAKGWPCEHEIHVAQ